MGSTRLNVLLGAAGAYVIRDPQYDALNLPAGEFDVPLIIADRTINALGQLVVPPTWQMHTFGEGRHAGCCCCRSNGPASSTGQLILVNGKVWPFMNVKRAKYRFRVLNGCNNRFLQLRLNGTTPPPFVAVATDTGLLPQPMQLDTFLLAPGERIEVGSPWKRKHQRQTGGLPDLRRWSSTSTFWPPARPSS